MFPHDICLHLHHQKEHLFMFLQFGNQIYSLSFSCFPYFSKQKIILKKGKQIDSKILFGFHFLYYENHKQHHISTDNTKMALCVLKN